ncbi:DUF4910 domain-containing protein [Candidatus Pelagibacter sp.]|nr:DUF4910 domain-containing protein [Candidatus Pelagibacter sp.]
MLGEKILKDIKKLYPLNRSLTGNGNRKTLKLLKKNISNLKILEFKSGTKIFDWVIPPEWNVKNAWISYNNKKIIDFKKSNLHLVSYSAPINKMVSFEELENHLYYLKKNPNAIPYVTSYYKKRWGFCLKYNQFAKLGKKKKFHVYIDSNFNKKGSMSVGEVIIKGKINKEIILSTNICHPSMVSNELAAPVILSHLANYFKKNKPYYTLRILFLPETIGCLTYLKYNLQNIKSKFRAGFHISCIGDNGPFSMVQTKYKNSYSDKISKILLKEKKKFKIYDFKLCGSDERQYNFPGIDLPVVTLTRSRFGTYKEYHTSMDNLKITNKKLLQESYDFLIKLVKKVNNDKDVKLQNVNKVIKNEKLIKDNKKKFNEDFKVYSLTKGEPFLSKRNLYRSLSNNTSLFDYPDEQFLMFNTLYYGDGLRISQIAKIISRNPKKVLQMAKVLFKNKLVRLSKN